MDNKEKGRIGLIKAISYFGLKGYTINIPLNDTQWYDLIVEKDGILKTVQCKCTTTDDNTISLRNRLFVLYRYSWFLNNSSRWY